MKVMRISELEKETGVPRRTIYYYVSEGMLPRAQNAGRSIGLYTEEHARRLLKIRRLRNEGLSLADIRRYLDSDGEQALDNGMDLVARRDAEIRERILVTAMRKFGSKGYRKTRVAEIISELGIAPSVLYRHFRSKKALLLAVVDGLGQMMLERVEPSLAPDPDPIVRFMRRAQGFLAIRDVSPESLAFVRVEALGDDRELRRHVRRHYMALLEPSTEELEQSIPEDDPPPFVDAELMSYAFRGAQEGIMMRMAWDKKYSERDFYWASLFLYAGVNAVFSHQHELRETCARYADLIEELVKQGPATPPALLPRRRKSS